MDYLKAIYQQNKRILEALEKNKQWVKVSVIVKMTGWNHEQLRMARENGSVEWKKDSKGIWYNVDSLLPIHIKKQTIQ